MAGRVYSNDAGNDLLPNLQYLCGFSHSSDMPSTPKFLLCPHQRTSVTILRAFDRMPSSYVRSSALLSHAELQITACPPSCRAANFGSIRAFGCVHFAVHSSISCMHRFSIFSCTEGRRAHMRGQLLRETYTSWPLTFAGTGDA